MIVESEGFRAAERGHVKQFARGDVPVVEAGNAVEALA